MMGGKGSAVCVSKVQRTRDRSEAFFNKGKEIATVPVHKALLTDHFHVFECTLQWFVAAKVTDNHSLEC